uniref:Late expression factor 11 n=1 Tax=Lymantria dispar multicapsid nuclear polyhedrosis virus TaxID=10449 RepID=A0A1B1MR13_NPVLD|nr:late expression factor 11 [Lymantria dispar multiple nucleopolyhedrovirus]
MAYFSTKLCDGHPERVARNRNHCLTRSEVYALLRETINKRKHCGDTRNVCAHLFDEAFVDQIDYIRENLATAFIVVGDNCKERKCLAQHDTRFDRIFSLKQRSLQSEYQLSANRYGERFRFESGQRQRRCRPRREHERLAAQVREQQSEQDRVRDNPVQNSVVRKKEDSLSHQSVGGAQCRQEDGEARQEEQPQQ